MNNIMELESVAMVDVHQRGVAFGHNTHRAQGVYGMSHSRQCQTEHMIAA